MTNEDNTHHTKLPKLTDNGIDNNYGEWKIQSYHALLDWDLLQYIEGDNSDPPIIPPLRQSQTYHGIDDAGNTSVTHVPGNTAEYTQAVANARPWMASNNTALARIIAALPGHQLHLIEGVKYAKQAWEALRSVYQPRNSMRATTIKRELISYRCQSDMDVTKWLSDMQRLYHSLRDLDNQRMTDRDFALALLDLMPQDNGWRDFISGLRNKVREADATETPIDSITYVLAIRDEDWYRHRTDDNVASRIFSAQSEASKRKRPRATDLVASSTAAPSPTKRTRLRNPDKKCSNPHCGSPRGHDTTECIAYTGAKQGQYEDWWRGPWNIHLPESQRSKENNVPPPSHAAHTRQPKPSINQSHISSDRSTTTPIHSSDQSAHINSTLADSPDYYAWNSSFTDSTIHATLPVLDDALPRDNSCHHDSGANRHVFYDRSSFETYKSTDEITVKGFGQNLSASAIGIGTVRLEAHYNNRKHIILLDNVLHIPAARSNLISGIQLDKAGVVSTLGNYTIFLSFNNKIIVQGTVEKDMYRLNVNILRPNPAPLITRLSPPSNPVPLITRLSPTSNPPPLITRLSPPSLQSRLGPQVFRSQATPGFYIA